MKNLLLFLAIFISFSSCFYDTEDYFQLRDPKYNPEVILNPEKVFANGKDSLRIKVYFPMIVDRDFAKVNFSTTEGVFYENNKSEYSNSELHYDKAKDKLFISSTIKTTTTAGDFLLHIEIPEAYKIPTNIKFHNSHPTSINSSTNKFAVANTYKDEIELIANLKSSPGLPSKGTEVEFIVADTISSNNSSLFRQITKTNDEGKASAYFSAGAFSGYIGPIRYTVKTQNEKGEILSSSGTFQIVEPD